MKFEQFIRMSGLNPDNYPLISGIDVPVYDRKGRTLGENDFTFEKPIFRRNTRSLDLFKAFIETYNPNENMLFHVRLYDTCVVIVKDREPLFLFTDSTSCTITSD